jgi:hypothetical protein
MSEGGGFGSAPNARQRRGRSASALAEKASGGSSSLGSARISLRFTRARGSAPGSRLTLVRTFPAEHDHLDTRSVLALILGEHGDSEIAAWSGACSGGTPLRHHTILGRRQDPALMTAILTQVRRAADRSPRSSSPGYVSPCVASATLDLAIRIHGASVRLC